MSSQNDYPEIRSIDFEESLIELAFHEASHFIFCRLLLRLNLNYSKVTCIYIHCNKDASTEEEKKQNLIGYVSGGGANVPQNKIQIRKFYFENPKRYIASNLMLMAGYVSRLVFINPSPYFINDVDRLCNYKGLDSKIYFLPEYAPSYIGDIQQIRKNLTHSKETTLLYENHVQQLISDLKELMRIPSIALPIKYVKNVLVKNNSKKITGKELESITYKVDTLLGNFSLEETISKYL